MSTEASAADVTRAVLGRRTRLILGQRLGSRANQILSPRAAARTPAWRAIAAASAVGDLALARWLGDNDRFAFGPRMAMDALDIALWTAAAPDEFEAQQGAAIPGIPLAVEAGVRLGLLGLVVPSVNALVAVSVAKAQGKRARPRQLLWQAAGVVGGVGLAAYGRQRRRQEIARHRRELEPLLEAAELAGMSEMSVGGDPVLDTVQRATTLTHLLTGGRTELGGAAAAWKLDLADRVRERHVYTGDLLLRWQSAHNVDPDLQRTVVFTVDPDVSTTVLDPTLATTLWDELDRLDLTGTVIIGPSPAPIDPRREVGLRIEALGCAPLDVVLRSESPVPGLAFDPLPGAFLWSALWLCVPLSRSREAVRWWSALPLAASATAAAVITHRAGVKAGPGSNEHAARAVGASFLLTATATAMQTRAMRSPHAGDGSQRVPFGMALQGFELVGACAGDRVPPASLAAGGAAVVALSWVLTPSPKRVRTHLAEVVWPVATALSASSWPLSINEDSNRLALEVRADDEAKIEAAFERGRQQVVTLLEGCIAEAEDDVRAAQGLDTRELAELRRRLDLAHDRLRVVGAPRLWRD